MAEKEKSKAVRRTDKPVEDDNKAVDNNDSLGRNNVGPPLVGFLGPGQDWVRIRIVRVNRSYALSAGGLFRRIVSLSVRDDRVGGFYRHLWCPTEHERDLHLALSL